MSEEVVKGAGENDGAAGDANSAQAANVVDAAGGGNDGGGVDVGDNGSGSGKIIRVNIEEQMKSAYIDYSMSVIVSRALPDVRDGMKPVHRRILYGMSNELNLYSDKPHRKSARIVGDVMGKFHPHGDRSIYDAMVRMAQEWSMRYPLVDGQGNFGSIDGDGPAAMRYTEARMKKLADEVMADIDKDTVDFVGNFDETILEPTVLPTKVPLLLLNGASGCRNGYEYGSAQPYRGYGRMLCLHRQQRYRDIGADAFRQGSGFSDGRYNLRISGSQGGDGNRSRPCGDARQDRNRVHSQRSCMYRHKGNTLYGE